MKIIHILGMLLVALAVKAASPIEGLLERIDKGASRKFMIEQVKSPVDFFELDQKGDKVVIRGNNYVSIATGLNWYLKYHVGIHLSWNGMQAELPEVLPAVKQKERHETDMKYRYDFNYCTFSYTMAFTGSMPYSRIRFTIRFCKAICCLYQLSEFGPPQPSLTCRWRWSGRMAFGTMC